MSLANQAFRVGSMLITFFFFLICLPMACSLNFRAPLDSGAANLDGGVKQDATTPDSGQLDGSPGDEIPEGAIWVSASGADTETCGDRQMACRTVQYAFSRLQPGGTLVVSDGVYDDNRGMLINDRTDSGFAAIPSGLDRQHRTTIRAETPFGVRLRFTGGLGYYESPVGISEAHFVRVDGFIIEQMNLESPSYTVDIAADENIVTRTIVKRNAVDQYGGWFSLTGNYTLCEDCAGVGAARYGFYSGSSGEETVVEGVIFRRCVGRMDFNDSLQPKATFAFYGNNTGHLARNFRFQNVIAIDGRRGPFQEGEDKYGGIYFPKNATDGAIEGSIVLNEEVGHAGMFVQEENGQGIAVRNSVVWHVYGSEWCSGIHAGDPSVVDVVSVTVGDVCSSPLDGVTAENSLIDSPSEYLVDGGGSGADIYYRIGLPLSVYGDQGFDEETFTPLWPYPYEDVIARVFAEPMEPPAGYVPDSNNSARGFARGGLDQYGQPLTLTRYIWQWLGSEIPPDIYGD